MRSIFPKVQAKGSVFWAGYNALVSMLLTVRKSIDERVIKHHDEAILRGLDRHLLADVGFERMPKIEITPDHASRSDFLPLSEPFSWTRFGK
jgi:hypothetical protein